MRVYVLIFLIIAILGIAITREGFGSYIPDGILTVTTCKNGCCTTEESIVHGDGSCSSLPEQVYAPAGSPSYHAPVGSPSAFAPASLPSRTPAFAPGIALGLAPGLAPAFAPGLAPAFAPAFAPTPAPAYAPSGYSPAYAPSPAPRLAPAPAPRPSPGIAPGYSPMYAPAPAPTPVPGPPPAPAPAPPCPPGYIYTKGVCVLGGTLTKSPVSIPRCGAFGAYTHTNGNTYCTGPARTVNTFDGISCGSDIGYCDSDSICFGGNINTTSPYPPDIKCLRLAPSTPSPPSLPPAPSPPTAAPRTAPAPRLGPAPPPPPEPTSCPADTYYSTQLASCISCPSNNGMPGKSPAGSIGIKECIQYCGKNEYSYKSPSVISTSAQRCYTCPDGTTSDAGYNNECDCPANSFMNEERECVKCPAGMSSPKGSSGRTFSDACKCPTNSYMSRKIDGTYTCITCGPGTLDTGGSGTKTGPTCSCPPNYFFSVEAGCVPCGRGGTSPAGSMSSDQCSCAANDYNSRKLSIPTCVSCGPGATSPAGSITCRCPANYYSSPGQGCFSCNADGATGGTSPAGSTSVTDCVCTASGTYNTNDTCGVRVGCARCGSGICPNEPC